MVCVIIPHLHTLGEGTMSFSPSISSTLNNPPIICLDCIKDFTRVDFMYYHSFHFFPFVFLLPSSLPSFLPWLPLSHHNKVEREGLWLPPPPHPIILPQPRHFFQLNPPLFFVHPSNHTPQIASFLFFVFNNEIGCCINTRALHADGSIMSSNPQPS